MYVYICIHMYTYVYIYIYIHRNVKPSNKMGVGHFTLTTTYVETPPNRFSELKPNNAVHCQTAAFWGCFIPAIFLKVVIVHCSVFMLTIGFTKVYHMAHMAMLLASALDAPRSWRLALKRGIHFRVDLLGGATDNHREIPFRGRKRKLVGGLGHPSEK